MNTEMLRKVAAGAVIGSLMGAASYAVTGRQPTLDGMGVATPHASQDPQVVDVLVQLQPYAQYNPRAFKRLVAVADAIVELYLELFKPLAEQSRYLLSNQVKVQELVQVVDSLLGEIQSSTLKEAPEEAEILEENVQGFRSVVLSYFDNIFTDSLERASGGNEDDDDIFARAHGPYAAAAY